MTPLCHSTPTSTKIAQVPVVSQPPPVCSSKSGLFADDDEHAAESVARNDRSSRGFTPWRPNKADQPPSPVRRTQPLPKSSPQGPLAVTQQPAANPAPTQNLGLQDPTRRPPSGAC